MISCIAVNIEFESTIDEVDRTILGGALLPTRQDPFDCSLPEPDIQPVIGTEIIGEITDHLTPLYSQPLHSDARSLLPPPGSGFPIGSDVNITFLYFQVHFPVYSETIGRMTSSIRAKVTVTMDPLEYKSGMIYLTAEDFDRHETLGLPVSSREVSFQIRDQTRVRITGWLIHAINAANLTIVVGKETDDEKILIANYTASSDHEVHAGSSVDYVAGKGDWITGRCDFLIPS